MLFEERDAFANVVHNLFPEEALYKAAYVASLLEQGDECRARAYAVNYSDSPEVYLRDIPSRMRELKAELLKKPLTL
jgi:hypothetical protein